MEIIGSINIALYGDEVRADLGFSENGLCVREEDGWSWVADARNVAHASEIANTMFKKQNYALQLLS